MFDEGSNGSRVRRLIGSAESLGLNIMDRAPSEWRFINMTKKYLLLSDPPDFNPLNSAGAPR